MRLSVITTALLGLLFTFAGVQTANADHSPEHVQDIDYSFHNIGGHWQGKIVHLRKSGVQPAGKTRICLVNRTGKIKYIWWSKIQDGIGHLTANPHSQSCATVKAGQRVEWNFYHGNQDIQASGMNLGKKGGELITFEWVSDMYRQPVKTGLTTWLGTAPACGAFADDCKRHGMEYITWSNNGDGKTCLGFGYKIQCRMWKRPTPPTITEDVNAFNVLSYNIYARPYIIAHDGQRERSCQVPRAIADYERSRKIRIDAIAFSEAFINGCEGEIDLRRALAHHGWTVTTNPTKGHGTRSAFSNNSGLLIASRWPINVQDEMVFKASKFGTADFLAPKGVNYARIKKTVNGQSKYYNLFATHFQAWAGGGDNGKAVRANQAKEMAAFYRRKASNRDEAVILAGDFNVNGMGNSEEFAALKNNLDATIPTLPEKGRTHVHKLNDWSREGANKSGKWLDFVMIANDYRQPVSQSIEAKALSVKKFAYCSSSNLPHSVNPESGDCKKAASTGFLSDHAAVLGKFVFE